MMCPKQQKISVLSAQVVLIIFVVIIIIIIIICVNIYIDIAMIVITICVYALSLLPLLSSIIQLLVIRCFDSSNQVKRALATKVLHSTVLLKNSWFKEVTSIKEM